MVDKKHLRGEVLRKRKSLSEEEVKRLSAAVIGKLKELDWFKKAKSVMFYYPVGGEVDLLPLLRELLREKTKSVLLPKVTADGEMVAIELTDLGVLRKGKFGIPEPSGGKIVKAEKIDLVIVPAVAFDERGNRIGMGKGFYDRFLPRVKGKKVGVAYDFQVFPEGTFAVDDHDHPVDAVITPTRIYKRED
jgi:5-formyltetrahydrofolate cyclo-ligase